IKEVRAGDIAACVGLKEITTGETLCDPEAPVILERMEFPEPVISQAVEPKTKADQEKMGIALSQIGRASCRERVWVTACAGGRRHTRFSRDWSSDVCSSDLSRKSGRATSPPAWASRRSPQARRCAIPRRP